MIPIIPIITAIISNTADKKIPGFSQKIGEFTKSKTNMLAGSPMVTYGGYLLMQDHMNGIGHAYLIGGSVLLFIKDAIAKK